MRSFCPCRFGVRTGFDRWRLIPLNGTWHIGWNPQGTFLGATDPAASRLRSNSTGNAYVYMEVAARNVLLDRANVLLEYASAYRENKVTKLAKREVGVADQLLLDRLDRQVLIRNLDSMH
jgi:hypothetical protein